VALILSTDKEHIDPQRCVRCGICKSSCPTYLTVLNESMSARGRMALLGGISDGRVTPTNSLSQKIFSCLLCDACKDACPLGLDIPEIIYKGRESLRDHLFKVRLLGEIVRFSLYGMDIAFSLLRLLQRLLPERFDYLPPIAVNPLKKVQAVYRNRKAVARVALFLGCSVNYLYPSCGDALINILRKNNYEVVVLSGEVCCGAPLRSLGLKKEMISLAKKNVEIFKRVKAVAVISLCPTCTMMIKTQYPLLIVDSIPNIMDVNEFFVKYNILKGLTMKEMNVTYHDPCHLRYSLGITEEPRMIIRGIKGIRFIEMRHPEECCGFGGLYSLLFRKLSIDIGKRKIEGIKDTGAEMVVTSCPGCVMWLENIKRQTNTDIQVMHIINLIEKAQST